MLFFRSEAQVQQWCKAQGYPQRPIVRMDQLWALAKAWYATRLQPDSRRPQPNEMREIFARCGLTDPFWDPEADSFTVPGS
jgi:Alkylmercury lyase